MIFYRAGYKYQLGDDTCMVTIRGHTFVIDIDIVKKFSEHKWRVAKTSGRGQFYVYTKEEGNSIYLHRFVLDAKKGEIVDHINGNSLDNRRENLRIVTHKENSWNSKKKRNGITSKYRGVGFVKRDNAFQARIRTNDGRRISLGYFSNDRDAAIAYNEAAKEYHGEYARLNNV